MFAHRKQKTSNQDEKRRKRNTFTQTQCHSSKQQRQDICYNDSISRLHRSYAVTRARTHTHSVLLRHMSQQRRKFTKTSKHEEANKNNGTKNYLIKIQCTWQCVPIQHICLLFSFLQSKKTKTKREKKNVDDLKKCARNHKSQQKPTNEDEVEHREKKILYI